MNSVLSNDEKELLDLVQKKNIPSLRRAYSDRTAWLMACASELAYEKFEIEDALKLNRILSKSLEHVLNTENQKKLANLTKRLSDLNPEKYNETLFEFKEIISGEVKTFDIVDTDTQAIIIPTEKFLILSFRGTESYEDFYTYLDEYPTKCRSGGFIHSGFMTSYESIESEITKYLDAKEFANMPLYITGHSLGGALAIVAAKRLKHKDNIAACYTFGSPKVGDFDWVCTIKTPIYRVVNSVDIVPFSPPCQVFERFFKPILKGIPFIGDSFSDLLKDFKGYFDCGDMRWLSDCSPGNYEDIKLSTHISFLWWFCQIFKRGKFACGSLFRTAKKFVTEHGISIYRKKLAIIARRRNSKFFSESTNE